MNKSFNFFVAGLKGLRVISRISLPQNFAISKVFVLRDENVICDFADETIDTCRRLGIDHEIWDGSINSYAVADFNLFIGWTRLVPPSERNFIIHDSLLPQYRGFSPLISQLIAGCPVIGASLFTGNRHSYDTGRVMLQRSRPVDHPIRVSAAIELMADIYVEITQEFLRIASRGIKFLPNALEQEHRDATYSLWRDDEDYFVRWGWSSEKLVRFIYAVGPPYKGAKTVCGSEIMLIREASVVGDKNIVERPSAVGKVIQTVDGHPVVVCGDGLLKIDSLERLDGEQVLPLTQFRTRFKDHY